MRVVGRIKLYFKRLWRGLQRLPYKKWWFALIVASSLLFGWWDELAMWSISVWAGWWLPAIYYGIEYGVMLPASFYLAKKTVEKLPRLNKDRLTKNMATGLKQSIPIIIGFTAVRIIGLLWIPWMLKWWIQILPIIPFLSYFLYKMKKGGRR